MLLDTLHTDSPALPKAENDRLFYSVLEDYADITVKRERMKKMKADPYYNALQVKYAYAVTCHKAQGGQWKNVFLDQGYMTDEYLTPDYFRWLYTAFTRATGLSLCLDSAAVRHFRLRGRLPEHGTFRRRGAYLSDWDM